MNLFRNALRSLSGKRLRTLLTATGIGIGVCSVVVIGSIGNLGKQLLLNELEGLGVGGLTISADTSKTSKKLYTDHLELVRRSSAVESAIPIMVEYTWCNSAGGMEACVVWGIDSGSDQIISLSPLHGSLFSRGDIRAGDSVCLVDEAFARLIYKRDNIVGKQISLMLGSSFETFTVAGVVESGGNLLQGLLDGYIPTFVYIPYTTMQRLSGRTNLDSIAVMVTPDLDAETAGQQIISEMERAAGEEDLFKAENMARYKDQLTGIFGIVSGVLSTIASISLLVAGLSIMTVMFSSVTERRREIGIRKAIGARRGDILREFLLEAILLSLLGGGLGAALGIGVFWGGTLLLGVSIPPDWGLAGGCVLFAAAVGGIFSLLPARKAASLPPAEALRE
ncbi:MAG: FtsX-like permease family protein [Ruminococcaceae bacterium]|nr:FtsX-like permease family protein [Oscillospiraceae bacterium]